MRFSSGGWEFEIDLSATMGYSAAEAKSHCMCAYCRNFYAAVDSAFPDLRPFLAQFGINVEAPDELMPFEPTNIVTLYAVCGRILRVGSPLYINGATVYSETAEEAMINTKCPNPYFVLNVGPMEIPWVLLDIAQQVESSANQPSFLQRMRNWILKKSDSNFLN